MIKKIAVFCGSKEGSLTAYQEDAKKLGDALSRAGMTLVYGGGKVGLMGQIANQMLKNNAPVIGVIPKSLFKAEIAHDNLTELHVVHSMHERKALIHELADAYIMLPGGTGSLDEFFETFTWGQLGHHQKPFGILNSSDYYHYLLKFLDNAVSQGFLQAIFRDMMMVDQDAEQLIQRFINYRPQCENWISQPMQQALA